MRIGTRPWRRSHLAAIAALAVLSCAACTSNDAPAAPPDPNPSDAAATDAGPDGPVACDPALKPPDCGSCAPGENICFGMLWACRPDGVWDRVHCDPSTPDAGLSCPALHGNTPAADAATEGGPAPELCTSGWSNPSTCPTGAPTPGTACTGDGLECVYASPGPVVLNITRCDGPNSTWTSTSVLCGIVCATPDDGVIAISGQCGTAPEVTCGGGSSEQEALNRKVRDLAECCGGFNENGVTVQFDDGCATSMWLDRTAATGDFGACLANLLAGRRLSCAASLTCAHAEWSTIM